VETQRKTRKPGPRPKRSDTRFHGVYHRSDNNATRPYAAWLCYGGVTIQLGEFAKELDAAVVADFFRYILWSLDYEVWPIGEKRHRRPDPPNFPPLARLPISRREMNVIFHKFNHYGWLGVPAMNLRLLDYFNRANGVTARNV
jgi:hypothetical protein